MDRRWPGRHVHRPGASAATAHLIRRHRTPATLAFRPTVDTTGLTEAFTRVEQATIEAQATWLVFGAGGELFPLRPGLVNIRLGAAELRRLHRRRSGPSTVTLNDSWWTGPDGSERWQ